MRHGAELLLADLKFEIPDMTLERIKYQESLDRGVRSPWWRQGFDRAGGGFPHSHILGNSVLL